MTHKTPLQTSSPRQLLGRRLGLEPYYRITAQSPNQLVLESLPRANQRAGYRLIGSGGILILLGLIIFCSGLGGSGPMGGSGFGTLAFVTVLTAMLSGLGFLRLVGGIAVITTRNQITFDTTTGQISYTQRNRLARERLQVLPLDQVVRLQMRPRTLITAGLLSRRYPIHCLELVSNEGQIWIIDSAADPALLQPLATAVAAVLGMTVEQQPATG